MSSTDFYDEDLVKHRSSASRKTRGEGGAEDAETPPPAEAITRPVSDLNLNRMSRQREQVEDHMAHAAQELERLRQRQENLEKERSALEELRRRQAEYERGKREILEHLNHSIISLEKDELHAENLLQLVAETRNRCRGWLVDIDSINEEDWPEDQFREELAKGLSRIDDIRLEYNKALSKIDAMHTEETKGALRSPTYMEERARDVKEKSFGDWLKVGFAVSLPLILTLILLWLLYYMHGLGIL